MRRSTCAWTQAAASRPRNGSRARPKREIREVIRNYGEERFAKQIAAAIVAARARGPVGTTRQLAALVAEAVPTREPHQDPATRTFQALRIHLNQELEELSLALPQCVELLGPGGRLVVISFHSLEDRIVKRFLRDSARADPLPRAAAAARPRAAAAAPEADRPRGAAVRSRSRGEPPRAQRRDADRREACRRHRCSGSTSCCSPRSPPARWRWSPPSTRRASSTSSCRRSRSSPSSSKSSGGSCSSSRAPGRRTRAWRNSPIQSLGMRVPPASRVQVVPPAGAEAKP